MDSSDNPTTAGRSPRKELLGPRPTPLKIHKDSHKIKKPPVAPQQAPPRQPVIIYTVSPKIIHTNPSDFMNLVQRLTGLSSSSTSSTTCSPEAVAGNALNDNSSNSGAISPAARYAAIENARSPRDRGKKRSGGDQMSGSGVVEGMGTGTEMEMEMEDHDHHGGVEKKGLFPGILSPGPASLPPIAPNFFSPPSDSFFHDLSPVLHGNRNFIEGSFMPSPSYFISPHITSPTPSMDLFNNFSDL